MHRGVWKQHGQESKRPAALDTDVGRLGRRRFLDTAITTEEPRTMGILTVDLYDVAKKHLVWRGQATVDSVSNSQKGDEKQTEKSVEKMFKKYPPKK
jgi:hypothetical protein